jgi:hypothetical protein
MKITDVTCKCKSCDWTGVVEDCESGPDGDLLCPLCLGNVRVIMTDSALASGAESEVTK